MATNAMTAVRPQEGEVRLVSCVLRDLTGMMQYISVEDAGTLKPGEKIFTGRMSAGLIEDGPRMCPRATIWEPLGTPEVSYHQG